MYSYPAGLRRNISYWPKFTQTLSNEELKKHVEGNLCKIVDGERDLYL